MVCPLLQTRFDDLTKAVKNIYDVKLRYIKVETIEGGGVGSMCTSTCGTVEWCGGQSLKRRCPEV